MREHRTKRGEQRVRALIDTATDMFLSEGYEAVSVDGLIARAGGSRRNVYDRFGGKEGLFAEAVTALCVQLAAPLQALVIDGADPQKSLNVFGRKLLEIVLEPRTLALHRLMISEGCRFPTLAQSILKAGHLNAQRILARWIEDGQDADLIRKDADADKLAADFINLTVASIQLKALVGLEKQCTEEIEDVVRHAVTMFLNGAFQTYHGSTDA